MNYVIKNHKNLYIKLNENGRAVTCSEHEKTLFEYSKANNILNSLPKPLQKLKFLVVPDAENDTKKKVITNKDYIISPNIIDWFEKFGMCGDVLNDAKQRQKELIDELDKIDKELLDILHIIEMEPSKDLYKGWKVYKQIKENRKKRRNVKDELVILINVLEEIDPSCLQREKIQRAIDGLFKRKYKFRILEEEYEDDM